MTRSMILLLAVAGLLVPGTLTTKSSGAAWMAWTQAGATLILAITMLAACFRARSSWIRLAHLSLVIAILGIGLDRLTPRSFHTIPLSTELPDHAGWVPVHHFELGMTAFTITRYTPDYAWYRPFQTSAIPSRAGPPAGESVDYVRRGTLRPSADGGIRAGTAGHLPPGSLYHPGTPGEWVHQALLPDGSLIQLLPRKDQDYTATLLVHRDNQPPSTHTLRVNQPVSVDGVRLYLQSYDPETGQAITLLAHRTPGRIPALTGLLGLMIGTCAAILKRPGGGHAA